MRCSTVSSNYQCFLWLLNCLRPHQNKLSLFVYSNCSISAKFETIIADLEMHMSYRIPLANLETSTLVVKSLISIQFLCRIFCSRCSV